MARLMGLPKFMLTRILFSADSRYKEFRIPKRSGRGYRRIAAPSMELKGLQRWVSAFVLKPVKLSDDCMGFRKGRSIVDNAYRHIDNTFVLNVDIKDFFPTITRPRIIGMFKSMGYPKNVASALARLCTYKGVLPQGAPSSPDVSNIIGCRLDARLAAYCAKKSWKYSRYCDDISISGFQPPSQRQIDFICDQILAEEGFSVNRAKVHIRRQNSCQLVTGLVVNKHVSVPKYLRKRFRARLHRAMIDPGGHKNDYAEIAGFASFLRMVNPSDSLLMPDGKVSRTLAALQAAQSK